jgi:hypothetical protein
MAMTHGFQPDPCTAPVQAPLVYGNDHRLLSHQLPSVSLDSSHQSPLPKQSSPVWLGEEARGPCVGLNGAWIGCLET